MLLEAVAAVKIANEAIGAIKEFAGHISSVGELGPQLTKLADAKEVIEQKVKDGSTEHFFELEKIKQREAEIKNLFIYSGRPGLWTDYENFLRNRNQLRENERKRILQAKARKKRLIKEWCIGIAVAIAALSAVGIVGYVLYWLITTKGQ
jgi:preprotein translocase subunit Sss1